MSASSSKDDGLEKLHYLSLLSKLCSELENHLGFADKILAEYITEMGRTSDSLQQLDAKLKENAAEMLDYLVPTLFTVIQAILPPRRNMQEKGAKTSKYRVLAIPDDRQRVRKLEIEIESETRQRGIDRDRGKDRDRDGDRRRNRYDVDRHRGHGERNSRDSKYYSNVDNEPKLYKVYKGRVSRVMDTGCFEEEGDSLLYQEESEVEIELKDDEPEFLQGLTRLCVDMSPVKILKGSLARTAALQSALMKERREVRDQRERMSKRKRQRLASGNDKSESSHYMTNTTSLTHDA